MSDFTQFQPKFQVGHQRSAVGDVSIAGYLKCDGSIVLQSAYPELFSIVGLLSGTYDTNTEFKLPTSNQTTLLYGVSSNTYIKHS